LKKRTSEAGQLHRIGARGFARRGESHITIFQVHHIVPPVGGREGREFRGEDLAKRELWATSGGGKINIKSTLHYLEKRFGGEVPGGGDRIKR